MSPWSSDWLFEGINIGIGTREIAVGPRFPRWTRSRNTVSAAEPRTVTIPDAQRVTDAGVFDALRAAFDPVPDGDSPPAKGALSRSRRAHVVLDDFWGNHAILRGDFRTLRTREIDEIARAHFVDTYGIDAEAIVVRVCVQRGGRAAFASALPRKLVNGIREAGTSVGVRVQALKLCLPEMFNRALDKTPQPNAMLIFAADALLQAVLIEEGRWVGYDAQRLFAGDTSDPARIATLAEQAFEHCAERTEARREVCALGLQGIDIDPAPLEACFASVTVLGSPNAHTGESVARRLLEYAR